MEKNKNGSREIMPWTIFRIYGQDPLGVKVQERKKLPMYTEDTIAAISTPQGTGGIGIIRISGENAFTIAAKIFKGKKALEDIKTHTINFGKIVDPKDNDIIDEVLLTKMKKPNTFTREDVVEINCHGGIVVVKKIFELLLKNGARIAEPGEFTKRAFLNGRIDLSQAEAVIDIINAKTEASSRAAVDQLEGRLSRKIREIREKLIELIAHIEVTVDYPEHDIEEITGEKVYQEITKIAQLLEAFIKGFETGRIIREGLNLVIIGRPNVGKSSLLNELSGKNKAIVTDIPGTTRDIIEEFVNIKGIPVRITDTAGIRDTKDVVEKMGVEKAKKAIENADLIVLMIDVSGEVGEEEFEIIKQVGSRKYIVLLNKVDLVKEEKIRRIASEFKEADKIIRTSVKEGTGLNELEETIEEMFIKGDITSENDFILTNIRHKNLVEMALESISGAFEAFESGMPLDCITIDIKNAAEYLGQITGESVNDDVMHEIFSRFCIGK